MNIQEAKQTVMDTVRAYTARDAEGNYRIPPVRQRPILLMGPPGIGKTAVVEQAARECGVGLVSYTITHHTRQSAVGLPMVEQRMYDGRKFTVTEYTLSEILASVYRCMEETGCREGILFIDEINCVSETLAPTMLQFLQGKTFGNHPVPRGWIIAAAGNPPEYNQSVREFDVVTLDRVKYISVDIDYEAWKKYAVRQRIHGAIRAYLEGKPQNFYRMEQTPEHKEFVTARGWEDLSMILREYEELGIAVDEGLVGQYLQCPQIAGDFFGFYQMYQGCWRRFGGELERILKKDEIPGPGSETVGINEEDFTDVKGEAFPADVQLSAANLLISAVLDDAERWRRLKNQQEKCSREISRLLEQPKEEAFLTAMEAFVEDRERAFAVRDEAGLMTEEERGTENFCNQWLRRMYWDLKVRGIDGWKEAGDRLLHALAEKKKQAVSTGRSAVGKAGRVLEWLDKTFPGGLACMAAMEAFSSSESCMSLTAEYGCRPFEERSGRLMIRDRERSLQEEIRRLQEV